MKYAFMLYIMYNKNSYISGQYHGWT